MFRRLVSGLALAALLLQGAAVFAQPQLTPHSSVSVEAAQDDSTPSCHDSKPAAKKPAQKPSCCGDCNASCVKACGGGVTVLPQLPMELQDLISEHYSVLQTEPSLAPAHKFSTLRPPATPES